jgi:hypothetical protein
VGQKSFVLDTRRQPKLSRLADHELELLRRLDRPTLETTLESEWTHDLPRLRALLADLVARELVLESDGRLMRLVVFPEEPSIVKRVLRRVVSTVRRAW